MVFKVSSKTQFNYFKSALCAGPLDFSLQYFRTFKQNMYCYSNVFWCSQLTRNKGQGSILRGLTPPPSGIEE